VTGASHGGIGGAICRRLASDALARGYRARVTISATGASPGFAVLAEDLRWLGADVLTVPGDLCDPEFPGSLVQQAAEFCGGLDLVASNAGRTAHGQLADTSLEAWDTSFAVHVRAAWLLAKAAFPYLKESGGSFIATGSVSGTLPHADHEAYPAAKAALIMLCRTLALEWAGAGVRVNVVSPGPVSTAASDKAGAAAVIPLRRAGLPDDVAAAVAFLAGPDAAYITGQNLLVDGGLAQARLGVLSRADPLGVLHG
jgi:NAD(P)-dependent dehydrogenase (short-subunit alcohol dehydrogenase family)